MKNIIKLLQISFFTLILSLICFSSIRAQENTGTYISDALGETNAYFLEFTTIDESKPEGTNLTFSFSGDESNYETWSLPAMTENSKIDLTKVYEIKNSSFIKVKIIFTPNNENSPSLRAFSVSYDILGSEQERIEIINQENTVEQNASANIPSLTHNKEDEITTTTIPTGSNINTLASTGGNIWYYIAAALIVSILAVAIIFRKK